VKAARLAAAALLAALFLQCVLSMRLLSATYDEHAHLPAGYTYWKTGDLRLNPQHPPLVKLLAGLPLLFLDPRVDWQDESWAGPRPSQWRFGARFFYGWGNDADRLLFWGRLPIVLLALLLGLYVFRWSAERFGPRAGVYGLLLYAFCPNIIAHGRLVTMDLALSAFTTIALYYLWRFLREGTMRPLVLCAVALGLALASKFSALVIAAMVVGWLVMRPVRAAAPAATKKEKKKRAASPAEVSWAAAIGVVAGISVVLAWMSYLLPADPAFYWKGVAIVNRDHRADHFYYLMGAFKQGRWWYYFLAALAFKTPVPAIVSTVIAAVLAWRSKATTGRDDLLLVIPALGFLAFTSAMADNLGVRYVLPLFPLMFVFTSRIAEPLSRDRRGLVVLAVLAAWQIAGTLRAFPDHLAYFNEPSGGVARGYRLLDDSNIDWGQDLKRLGTYLKEQKPAGPVRVCYDLNGHPPYYGVDTDRITMQQLASPPAPGFYAIAAHCLVRLQTLNQPGQPDLDWLRRYPSLGRVGAFYLFRFP
jgi:hypothetical protein